MPVLFPGQQEQHLQGEQVQVPPDLHAEQHWQLFPHWQCAAELIAPVAEAAAAPTTPAAPAALPGQQPQQSQDLQEQEPPDLQAEQHLQEAPQQQEPLAGAAAALPVALCPGQQQQHLQAEQVQAPPDLQAEQHWQLSPQQQELPEEAAGWLAALVSDA